MSAALNTVSAQPGPTEIPPSFQRELEQDFDAKLRPPVLAALKNLGVDNPAEEQIVGAIEALKAIGAPRIKPVIPFKERVRETLAYIEQLAKTKPQSVIKFGIDALDDALLPIEPGNQIVICSETGGGKTTLACQAVLNSSDKPFAIFSLEMPARSLIMRMFSAEGSVQLSNLRRGRLTGQEFPRLESAVERLAQRNIYIEDDQLFDVRSIAARCRTLKQSGLSAVVVDYLQLVAPSTTGKRDVSREREVAEISRSLKSLALELGVVVIALSQLNENGQLRESRAIGQDADVVLRVIPGDEGGASIHIQKHRNGPRRNFLVKFNGPYLRFTASENKAPARDPSGSLPL